MWRHYGWPCRNGCRQPRPEPGEVALVAPAAAPAAAATTPVTTATIPTAGCAIAEAVSAPIDIGAAEIAAAMHRLSVALIPHAPYALAVGPVVEAIGDAQLVIECKQQGQAARMA